MTNDVADIREVPIRADTRFVLTRPGSIRFQLNDVNVVIAQTPWTIVRPQDASEALTDGTVRNHDWLWGWALIEDGAMVEFFDTDRWQIRNTTHVGHQPAIAATILPQEPDYRPPPRAADGFDGSGCSPDTGSLPDGTWFGRVAHESPRDIRFDLLCASSDPEMWDRLGLDTLSIEDRTVVDDGDPTEYPLTIADGAVLDLTSIDHYGLQTPLTVDDPRYQHFMAKPDPVYRQGMWLRVEGGVVTGGFVPFEA